MFRYLNLTWLPHCPSPTELSLLDLFLHSIFYLALFLHLQFLVAFISITAYVFSPPTELYFPWVSGIWSINAEKKTKPDIVSRLVRFLQYVANISSSHFAPLKYGNHHNTLYLHTS